MHSASYVLLDEINIKEVSAISCIELRTQNTRSCSGDLNTCRLDRLLHSWLLDSYFPNKLNVAESSCPCFTIREEFCGTCYGVRFRR